MLPLSRLSAAEARALQGLAFDLDDTLLDAGQLPEAAYSSLFRLRESGLALVALTGRPASWAELIARIWPVAAAVAENGAISFVRRGERIETRDTVSSAVRSERRRALASLVDETRARLPGLIPADDVAGRISDFTFDIGEHQRADEATIDSAVALAEDRGARTTRSSVHLHFSFDRIDKASGLLELSSELGFERTSALSRYAFIGDSQNDASCFAAFRSSVGVANLRGSFSLLPRYQTAAARSEGFVELAATLCRLRSGISADGPAR